MEIFRHLRIRLVHSRKVVVDFSPGEDNQTGNAENSTTTEQARMGREKRTPAQIVNKVIRIYIRLATIAQTLAEGFRFQTVQQAIP